MKRKLIFVAVSLIVLLTFASCKQLDVIGNTSITSFKDNESLTYDGDATPLTSYENIVKLKRDSINYHSALDHYGVNLGDGNVFEWAKDLSTNDKDIVFVLNPKVFIDAGVDPQKLEGWVFAKVETMDMNGKPIEVEKFLKPFDLINWVINI